MSATARAMLGEIKIADNAVSASTVFNCATPSVPAVPKRSQSRDAFAAIRHDCAVLSTSIIVVGPEESIVPLRPVERGEGFRGKHGKLTIIRKVAK